MANELIKPIDENTAKAIEESAKSIGKGIDLVGGLGAYLSRALGGVPENLLGLLVGDWLIHKRVRRWAGLQAETLRILEQRKVQEPYEDISPSVAIPLIEAALDEDREGLKDIWAKLLASAMDPKRKDYVRRDLMEAVKALEPLDALAFDSFTNNPLSKGQHLRQTLAERLGVDMDDISVAVSALTKVGLIGSADQNTFFTASLGKLLLKAIDG
jgi:Abortive infection alpha